MKGFLATALAAVHRLSPNRMRHPLHIAVSSDEEVGCRGVRPLLDTVAASPVPPARALVGEPTMLRVVDRHKGKSAVRVHLRGRAAHSSLAPKGVNAVAYAGRLITELLALQRELASGPGDPAYAVAFPTIGIGPIHGGVSVNIVPDRCALEVEVRALPEQDPEHLVERIRELAGALEREMRGMYADARIALEPMSAYPGLRPSVDDAFAAEVATLTGDAAIGAADFGTEAGLYQQRLGIPVVVCGPGSMADAHRADESVAIEQLERSERLVRELAEALYVD
jgi:acetylornithine deacetylase